MKTESLNRKDYVKWWTVEYFGTYGIYLPYRSSISRAEDEVVTKLINSANANIEEFGVLGIEPYFCKNC